MACRISRATATGIRLIPAARRFGEERCKTPTGSPAPLQSLGRRLRPLILPSLIADPPGDTGAEILEQRQRVGRVAADKRLGPVPQPSLWIRILLDRQCTEVGPLVIRIPERIKGSRGGNIEHWVGDSFELNLCKTINNQALGHSLKGGGRDSIAEDILRPGHNRRGRDHHLARNKPKVAALTRTQHQAVWPEAHQPTIAISCPVSDLERNQGQLPIIKSVSEKG